MQVCFIFPQSVVSYEGDQVVHVQKWDGKETTIVREVKDNNMIVVRVYLIITW